MECCHAVDLRRVDVCAFVEQGADGCFVEFLGGVG